jgi:N-carbamoylputrescine amidase
MPRNFTVGLVQMACASDPGEGLERAASRVRQAARAGAQVVCLPELFRSPYFCQREDPACFDLAEPVPGPTTEALGRVAKEEQVAVIAPVFERRASGVYHNSAAVIDADGRVLGLYRKMHIPDDPAYYEKFYFTPGDLGFRAFDTRSGRIGTLICWDQWFPEAARLAALRGAAVLFYPTAVGWHPYEKEAFGAAQRDAWRTVQRGHAISNGVYVAAVNRVGHEPPPASAPGQGTSAGSGQGIGPGIEFWGSSFVADPFGVVVAEAAADREQILLAEIDLDRIEEVRRNWPFLRDRRIDAYGGLEQRFLDEG